ncbi:Carboxylesterase, biotin synthesis protein [gamma proteobacterium HdN1]|nr:Carboxylesterase, biotin synthesis protein [gamma proteobacterium HdN1]
MSEYAIVLLSGWGVRSCVWDAVRPTFERYARVFRLDLGELASCAAAQGRSITLDVLVDLLAEATPERAVWIGWSLGGMVAARFAVRWPERVAALVTVATNPCFTARETWRQAMPEAEFLDFSRRFERDVEGALQRFLTLQCSGSETARVDARALKACVSPCDGDTLKWLQDGLRILRDADLREDYQRIDVPSMHLLGENDALVPAGVAEDILRLQPGARVRVMQGLSHVPFVSAPRVFAGLVEEFLGGCYAGRSSRA